ncbi:hypothetical protein HK100_005044 [Physocladia obscura]|uniref:Nephrocystin 3-like N-terminal domain-containing protein n=1 Tax=Physocladia obscura TaxID=109957 RepID=A0AAD5TAE4_9FUNG|nr:hypothetical protein HK100_005044 [Physocladia obscura]
MVLQATPVTLSIWLAGGEDDDVVEVTINQLLVSELKNEIQVAFDLSSSAFDIIYSYRKDGFIPHKLKPTPNSKLKNILANVDINQDLRFEIALHPHKIKIICDGKEPLVLEIEKLVISKLRNEVKFKLIGITQKLNLWRQVEKCFPEICNYMLQYDEDGVKTVLNSDSALEDLHSRESTTGSRPTVFVVSIPAKQSQSIINLAHRPGANTFNAPSDRVLDISTEKRFDVMLSYSWGTKQQVKLLYQELMNRFKDLKIWLDEREMDTDIYSSMVEGVVKSDVVITSPNCMREIKFAADLKKPLIPTRMFLDSDNITQILESPDMAVPFLITAGLLYIDFKESLPPSVEWNSAMNTISGQIESRIPRFSNQKISQLSDPFQSWLQPVDFTSDIDNYVSEYVKGTREWINDVFSEWQVSNEPFLWLCAGAGTGKSLIAYKVSKSPPPNYTLGSIFFCKHNDEQKNSVVKIVSSMAWNLCNQFPEIKAHLHLEMAKDKQRTDGGKISILSNPVEAFKSLIVDGFSTFKTDSQVKKNSNILLIIDALDECDPKTRHNLLLILTHSCKALPDFVKVFATGRPDLDIFESLKSIDPFVLKPTSKENLADVKTFITAKLKNMWNASDEKIASDDEMVACVDTLLQKSEGVFIYARNACEFLLKSPNTSPKSIFTQIHEFESGPDSVYSLILNREYGAANVSEIDSFRRVIGTILTIKEPVSIGTLISLGNLTANETGLLRAVLKIEHGVVSVIHKSLKDFLSDIKRSGVFFVDTVFINEQLAKSCFEIMNSELDENMAKLDSFEEYHATSGSISAISSELAYACIFWADHLISCSNQEMLIFLLLEFCKKKLLNFIEACLILGKLNMAIFSFAKGLEAIDSVPENKETSFIKDCLQDGKKVVINYRLLLLWCPLQIYKTVLLMLPHKCVLYEQYHKQSDPFVSVGASKTLGPLTFEGHTEPVTSVVFGQSGKLIVSSAEDSTIKLWNAGTGECVSTIVTSHIRTITQISLSKNEEIITSVGRDCAKVWKKSTGECILTLNGHSKRIYTVALTDKYILTGSVDLTVKVWSLITGNCLRTLIGLGAIVNQIKVSVDGMLVAAAGSVETIIVWRVNTGELEKVYFSDSTAFRCIDLSSDNKLIASGDLQASVKIWDFDSGECISTLYKHTNEILGVAFSPDSKTLVSGSKDNLVNVWSVATGDCLSSLEGHTFWISSVAFSPSGLTFASASYDKTINVWPANAKSTNIMEKHFGNVTSVFISQDESIMCSGSTDNSVRIWSIETGDCLITLKSHIDWVNDVCLSSDNLLLVSASRDKTVKLWSLKSCKCLQTLQGHQDYVKTVRFSSDNSLVISGSNDKSVKIWSVETGYCLKTLLSHEDFVTSVCFSSDQSLAASTSRDQSVKVWDVALGKIVHSFKTDSKWIRDVEFRNDCDAVVVNMSQVGWDTVKNFEEKFMGWSIVDGANISEEYHRPKGLMVRGGFIFSDGKRIFRLPQFAARVRFARGKVVGLANGNMVFAWKFP